MLSWLLLCALTALAAVAALGITVRAEPEGRAEAGVLFSALFVAVIVAPVLALGYTSQLRPALLAVLSPLVSALALLASCHGRSWLEHVGAIRRLAAGLARLPWDALRLAARARSFALLGVGVALLAVGVSAWLTYLAPSESWDGFFYHEPIIGLAIQNHGFRMVPLPPVMVVQGANGYPRLCEAFALWFVVFTDKTWIEIGNTLLAPGLMLATYAMARRYGSDRVPAMGWGAAVLLMPAMLTQLRTSMIDVQLAFFLVAATHYATRPVLRLRDAAAAALCMALVLGSKSSGLASVPPLFLMTFGRLLLRERRQRLGAALGLATASGLGLAGVAGLTFVRNWLAFHNPIWPASYANPRLGIDWPGLVSLERLCPDLALRDLVEQKYHVPVGGIADIIARDYGYGVPWVVVPLAAVALTVLGAVVVRARLARSPDARAENLLLVALLGAAFVKWSPSVAIARYNAHVVAIAVVGVAWCLGRARRSLRLHEGAIAATLVMTLVPWVWTGWFFGVDLRWRDIAALLRHSAAERATMNVAGFQMPPDVARARERELGPGDVAVFTQELAFPGVLWNHRLSNRVEYVEFKAADAFLARVDELRAKWVVVGAHSPGRAALSARAEQWTLVGTAVRQDGTVVLRRR